MEPDILFLGQAPGTMYHKREMFYIIDIIYPPCFFQTFRVFSGVMQPNNKVELSAEIHEYVP